MAYAEELAQRIRDFAPRFPTFTEKKMFGGIAFMVNGNMLCGVLGDSMMARIGPDNFAAALAMPHVRAMDYNGRSMRGYVFVASTALASDQALAYWLDRCAQFVLTLPPKVK